MIKKPSFTLAEILITLLIIGVIAVLTIPNMIQGYKKHKVEIALKEIYSILNSAIKMSELDNDDKSSWNYGISPKNFSETYLFPYLKITKLCENNNNGSCFKGATGKYTFRTLTGDYKVYGYSFYSALLTNGMAIGIWTDVNKCSKMAQIAVDIDGPNNGESISGKDVFLFSLMTTNDIDVFLVPGQVNRCWKKNPMNYSIGQILGESIEAGCNPNAKETAEQWKGGLCSTAIAKNNWKIPDNYPVKF